VTFPGRSRRQLLVDATRKLESGAIARWLAELPEASK
jgi:hypothetical protein